MNLILRRICFLFFLFISFTGHAELYVGVGKTDITPPLGTPSAGYQARKGQGMQGVHDPLLAIALFINNGEKNIALCSVDHLGFTYEMVQKITEKVHNYPGLSSCEVYIASSHTHSGGGAFLNIPVIGESLAGSYNPNITEFYEEQTAQAIIQASQHQVLAKIGIGYGKASNLSEYRGLWPTNVSPLPDVALLKVTKMDNTPLAVLFNFPVHPTVLGSHNLFFSADFVGYTRDKIQSSLGSSIQPLYFNGAQGDIIPFISNKEDHFDSCQNLGEALAQSIEKIWNKTEVSESFEISTSKISYTFKPETTSFGLLLPIENYATEINLLVFNQRQAFVTIPGELSCLYDKHFKKIGQQLGYEHVSIFGLTNDAHGYIILPESWRHKTFESRLSFGGENYGEKIEKHVFSLLKAHAP